MKRKWFITYDGTAKIKAGTTNHAEEKTSKMLPSYLPPCISIDVSTFPKIKARVTEQFQDESDREIQIRIEEARSEHNELRKQGRWEIFFYGECEVEAESTEQIGNRIEQDIRRGFKPDDSLTVSVDVSHEDDLTPSEMRALVPEANMVKYANALEGQKLFKVRFEGYALSMQRKHDDAYNEIRGLLSTIAHDVNVFRCPNYMDLQLRLKFWFNAMAYAMADNPKDAEGRIFANLSRIPEICKVERVFSITLGKVP
jgi:hypothetical protein